MRITGEGIRGEKEFWRKESRREWEWEWEWEWVDGAGWQWASIPIAIPRSSCCLTS
jgi:hypothetical protein